jgi:hypothetical protein
MTRSFSSSDQPRPRTSALSHYMLRISPILFCLSLRWRRVEIGRQVDDGEGDKLVASESTCPSKCKDRYSVSAAFLYTPSVSSRFYTKLLPVSLSLSHNLHSKLKAYLKHHHKAQQLPCIRPNQSHLPPRDRCSFGSCGRSGSRRVPIRPLAMRRTLGGLYGGDAAIGWLRGT